ncbi:DUF6279 family lipoprotein [Pleionea sp. CnH1-48]|uniref:DUF6279 family lipoprotein n=1 Tax=Pleionea sp. CnH1-48 TaxID=2954494 RepID=UPI002096B2F5|nr:DUF6279 family lipoprotein [Pleionea sp. CnH1-48]MCO7224844.1 DUF6279 family lipoprotein [Pleionea sp. CnH1-48]
MKMYRVLIILLLSLGLSGCGISFWYNNLDWIASWYIDDYVELTDEQEGQLELLINSKVRWHRQEQLPQYVSWLRQVYADIENETLPDQWLHHEQQMETFYLSLVHNISSDMIGMLGELNEEQISELEANLIDREKDWIEEYVDLDEQQQIKKRRKQIRKSVKGWIGRLTSSQEKLIDEWSRAVTPTAKFRSEYRQQWRESFIEQLRQPSTEASQAQLKRLIETPRHLRSAEYEKAFEENSDIARDYTFKLLTMLTKKQKRRLLSEIEDYIEVFEELMEEGD